MDSFEKIIHDVLVHQLELFSRILKKAPPPNWIADIQVDKNETFSNFLLGPSDPILITGILKELNLKLSHFAQELGTRSTPKLNLGDYLALY